jgi:hypothetical protein
MWQSEDEQAVRWSVAKQSSLQSQRDSNNKVIRGEIMQP